MRHSLMWLEVTLIVFAVLGVWYSISNFNSVKRILIGRPMRLKELQAQHTKLFWIIALPIAFQSQSKQLDTPSVNLVNTFNIAYEPQS